MNKRGKAPYNFVPLPEAIIPRYDSVENLPTHNASSEADQDLLSGEITFDITAQSPILVADGTERNDTRSPRSFVKNANGQYEIPGSSLRGLMRNVISVLSLSNWTEQIDDERFFYRMVGQTRSGLGQTYKEVLDARAQQVITYKNGEKKQAFVSYAGRVKAGYIVKEGRNQYSIYPAKTKGARKGKTYYPVHISRIAHNERYQFERNLKAGFIEQKAKFEVNEQGKPTKINAEQSDLQGVLLFSGFIQRKNTAYLINEIDYDKSKAIQISQDDVKAYTADLDFRETKFPANEKEKRKNFFSLPTVTGIEGAKPFFYIEYNGKLYFGKTQFLRLTYDYSTKETLPNHLQDYSKLDYAKALFGFTKNNNNKLNINYASRLSFLNSGITNNAQPIKPVHVVLGSPRASAYPMYVDADLNTGKALSYNEKNAQIRGMKQYWIKKAPSASNVGDNQNVASSLSLLPKNTTFQAKIRFDQLHKDELGLVLWALKYPNNHQLGMGKPFGYGVVQFENIACHVTNNKEMYTSLKDLFFTGLQTVEPETYIEHYLSYVKENFGHSLTELQSIKTFKKMKEVSILSPNQMEYMSLNQYRPQNVLPTVDELLSATTNNQGKSRNNNRPKKKQVNNERRTNRRHHERRRTGTNAPNANKGRGMTQNPFADLNKRLQQKGRKK